MPSVLFVLSAEHVSNALCEKAFELHCMVHFTGLDLFDDIPGGLAFVKLRREKADEDVNDPCTWAGVTCTNALVDSIEWGYTQFLRRISLRWMPGTAQWVTILEQRFAQPFDARVLPKNLRRLKIDNSDLQGTVEVQLLPRRIVELLLPSNSISGTLRLYKLPPTLKVIDLGWNKIKGLTVDGSQLTDTLMDVRVWGQRMEIVSLDDAPLDARIRLQRLPGEDDCV